MADLMRVLYLLLLSVVLTLSRGHLFGGYIVKKIRDSLRLFLSLSCSIGIVFILSEVLKLMCDYRKNKMIIEKQRKQYNRFRTHSASDTYHRLLRLRC